LILIVDLSFVVHGWLDDENVAGRHRELTIHQKVNVTIKQCISVH